MAGWLVQALTAPVAILIDAASFVVSAVTLGLISTLASGATVVSAILLLIQQLGDGFYTVYAINEVSLRQRLVSEHLLGRVNATIRSLGLAAVLAGSLLGGFLAQALSVRLMLAVAAGCTLAAAAALALSPVRSMKET